MIIPRRKKTKLSNWSWTLYFSVPFIAIVLGWAQWEWGPRALADFSNIKLLTQGIFFFIFVYSLLILPLKKWVWISETSLSSFQLIAFSTTVLSLPLMGFAYWVGEVRTVIQAQEVTISIIPAVLLSVLIYHNTQSLLQWSLSLATMVFYYVFMVNEILGPFKTVIYLLAQDYRFEYLRALIPACAIALYYRSQYEPTQTSLSGINAIHHAWKSGRFAKVFKTANPGEGSLKAKSKS